MTETAEQQARDLDGAAVFGRAEGVVLREVAGESLLVPVRKGVANLDVLFALNAVGAEIWRRLDGATPLDAVLDAVLEKFDVSREEARADLAEFVESLGQARLLERKA
ncbi:PqqD family protein [Acidobacteria bacterium ACD]|nr:MAG: PqqD family protein [Acidobacteriota bacterium]MCE7957028.1 PqqD family protein [Acidobacteria bacterium ACB2]MDL1949588.1 PqqD family protein [Acidobacteria bacterium ACD]